MKQEEYILPAIVVIAYDRHLSLSRLLKSIEQAHYDLTAIELIISIDASDNEKVSELAHSFQWKHGSKQIIRREEHLGLKEHVKRCAGLSNELGAVILLEDDLMLGPYFYEYATQAINYYRHEEEIAGISLYAYALAESCHLPFTPIYSGSDIYFMQLASSWGQVFTKEQWNSFIQYSERGQGSEEDLPSYINNWGEKSWKREFIQYMIGQNKYFVFPYHSHSTNFEDRGEHATDYGRFQVPLQLGNKKYCFQKLERGSVRYDAFFELEEEVLKERLPFFRDYELTVDTYGRKTSYKNYVLSSKRGDNPLRGYSGTMLPLIQNVLMDLEGDKLHFLKKEALSERTVEAEPRLFLQEVYKREELEAITFSLIIPLLSYEEKDLEEILDSLQRQTYSHWECLIVVHDSQRDELETFLRRKGFSQQINILVTQKNNDYFYFIKEALKQLRGEVISVLPAKGKLKSIHLNLVQQAFFQFRNLSFVQTKSAISAADRVNYPLYLQQLKTAKGTYEGMEQLFMRKHLLEEYDRFEVFGEAATLAWTLETLKKHKLYHLVSLHFGNLEKIRLSLPGELLKKIGRERHASPGVGKYLNWFLRFLYDKNIPFLRAMYPQLNNLHDVLRLDERNNTFYFDRY
jgi:glycosyltransferase involved in cell wall biosynthesis